MRKIFRYTAALLLPLLAACTAGVERLEDESRKEAPRTLGFGAYLQRGTVTRGGVEGVTTLSGLKDDGTDLGAAGFGVFAYHTDADLYVGDGYPDFMYNQQVSWDSGTSTFTYTPLAYWPNEYGENAASLGTDRLSFFAYAPFTETEPQSGELSDASAAGWGITGMSRNGRHGDPLIHYAVSSAHPVDLCWATVQTNEDITWATSAGTDQTLPKGLPWKDVQRPAATSQKLELTFRHATARLVVTVDATSALDAATHMYLRKVTFTGMQQRGTLNLNNIDPDKPRWLNYGGGAPLPTGGSFTLTESDFPFAEVTDTPQYLFTGGSLYAIPGPEQVSLTVEYDVETAKEDLPEFLGDGTTHGIALHNTVTKALGFSLEAGLSYTVNLHLGLDAVNFTATVADWEDAGSTDVHLPDQSALVLPGYQYLWEEGGTYMPASPYVLGADGVSVLEASPDMSWESSNEAVATVAADGQVTAVGAGTATITGTTVVNGRTYTARYKVYVNLVGGISLQASRTRLSVGGTATLTSAITWSGGLQGSPESYPAGLVAYASDAPGRVSVTPGTSYTTATAQGVAVGDKLEVSATVPAAYCVGGVQLSAACPMICIDTWPYSVSGSAKVKFAQANLEFYSADGVPTWTLLANPFTRQFSAENPDDNYGYVSPEEGSLPVTLFAWGTSGWDSGEATAYQPYSTSSSDSDYLPQNLTGTYAQADWGVYNTSGGRSISGLSGEGWRVPTAGEWDYLVGSSTARGGMYGLGKLNGTPGLFLLPDSNTWIDPQPGGTVFTAGGASYTDNSYTTAQWSALEEAGVVFLPAAGYRLGTSRSGWDTDGSYAASTNVDSDNNKRFHFAAGSAVTEATPHSTGSNVRLVKDL